MFINTKYKKFTNSACFYYLGFKIEMSCVPYPMSDKHPSSTLEHICLLNLWSKSQFCIDCCPWGACSGVSLVMTSAINFQGLFVNSPHVAQVQPSKSTYTCNKKECTLFKKYSFYIILFSVLQLQRHWCAWGIHLPKRLLR